MPRILKVHNVNDYARYIGAEELHPLISVIHYDELGHCRHSLNNYDVYGIYMNQGLPSVKYCAQELFLSHDYKRKEVLISTKFTPQLAQVYENSVEKMVDAKRLVPDAKWIGEALWINNSNRSKSDELIKEWWKQ